MKGIEMNNELIKKAIIGVTAVGLIGVGYFIGKRSDLRFVDVILKSI